MPFPHASCFSHDIIIVLWLLSCRVHKPTMRDDYDDIPFWYGAGFGNCNIEQDLAVAPWNLLSRDKAGKYPTAGIIFRKFCGFRRTDIPLNCLFLYSLSHYFVYELF